MATREATGRAAFWFWLAATAVTATRSLHREPLPRTVLPQKTAQNGGSEAEIEKIRAAYRQTGRGRRAETPHRLPAAGWKDILLRVYDEVWRDRILSVGAGVAFYGILAIVPFITAFVSVYGLVLDPQTVQSHLEAMGGVLPPEALSLVGDQLNRLASKPAENLGLGFLIGLGIALWSSNAGMKAMFEALNVAYEEDEKRSFVRLNLVSLTFTVGAILMLVILLAITLVLPLVLDFIGIGGMADALVRYGRWPAMLVVLIISLSVLYRFGPSRRRPRWRWVTWGSTVAALLFVLVSSLFSYYTANWAAYDETYGSLGTVVAFMTWLWLSSVVVLLGAELNAEMEHQTLADTTVPPERPIGRREAAVADTVGKARL